MESEYLFVYGTLKSDANNAYAQEFHAQAKLIGDARWQGGLYLIGNYPGAITSTSDGEFVFGELWKLYQPDETLRRLDIYEACASSSAFPHEYERSIQPVEVNGELLKAWIYIYQLSTSHLHRIESGLFWNQN